MWKFKFFSPPTFLSITRVVVTFCRVREGGDGAGRMGVRGGRNRVGGAWQQLEKPPELPGFPMQSTGLHIYGASSTQRYSSCTRPLPNQRRLWSPGVLGISITEPRFTCPEVRAPQLVWPGNFQLPFFGATFIMPPNVVGTPHPLVMPQLDAKFTVRAGISSTEKLYFAGFA